MPRGQKRAAAEDGEGRATRSKVAKTDGPKTPAKGGKRGPKTSMGAGAFKSKALPLHINITHTPPVLADDAVDVAQNDPGFIGSTTLTATSFSTGSYGWKGQKRMTIEVDGENGEKEKVQVMLNINATVLGSKSAPDDEHEAVEPQAEAAKAYEEAKADAETEEKTDGETSVIAGATQVEEDKQTEEPVLEEPEAPAQPEATS
ncbi:hypothetical protein PHLGIDRAFT_101409 [Phlebiopsis gigantea 11061_1 CR5-6]|uniref:Uncharacterized protein n=1 Tax=Phlebiopsis gigantea (strain 11061_1 CR5-6) TaxID=745531 RepID=A0A0C3S3W9_PHLG1|nr:hypothetical protein PHLGIDRAFT_101409 [Phlebiopsis gigantea 11061_1 CR5-6]